MTNEQREHQGSVSKRESSPRASHVRNKSEGQVAKQNSDSQRVSNGERRPSKEMTNEQGEHQRKPSEQGKPKVNTAPNKPRGKEPKPLHTSNSKSSEHGKPKVNSVSSESRRKDPKPVSTSDSQSLKKGTIKEHIHARASESDSNAVGSSHNDTNKHNNKVGVVADSKSINQSNKTQSRYQPSLRQPLRPGTSRNLTSTTALRLSQQIIRSLPAAQVMHGVTQPTHPPWLAASRSHNNSNTGWQYVNDTRQQSCNNNTVPQMSTRRKIDGGCKSTQCLVTVGGIDLESLSPDLPGRLVCCYCTDENQWKCVSNTMSVYLHHHGVAVVEGKLYIIGPCIKYSLNVKNKKMITCNFTNLIFKLFVN